MMKQTVISGIIFIFLAVFTGCSNAELPQNEIVKEAEPPQTQTAQIVEEKSDTLQNRLQEIHWQLVEILEEKVILGENERMPYVVLKLEKHRLQGFGGCNILFGTYVLGEAQKLNFTGIASTMKACPGLKLEQNFLKTLDLVERYNMEDEMLKMFDKEGKIIAKFEALD